MKPLHICDNISKKTYMVTKDHITTSLYYEYLNQGLPLEDEHMLEEEEA